MDKKRIKVVVANLVSPFDIPDNRDIHFERPDNLPDLQQLINKIYNDIDPEYRHDTGIEYDYDEYGLNIVISYYREETDDEYEERIEKENKKESEKKQREINMLNELIKKHGIPANTDI